MNATTVRVNRRAAEMRRTLGAPLIYHFRPRCVCWRAHVYTTHGQSGVPA